MNKRDLLWFLAYPLYQIIGTFRHEGAHALGVLLFGGEITAFAVLPTNKYWGYVDWEGPTNIFITAAPYLLDLFTFLLFYVICMNFGFRRHWLWLNLVILGVISPLVNSAYNYGAAIGRPNDIAALLHDLNPLLVHCYFILTILLYLQGLYFLFTRSNQLR